MRVLVAIAIAVVAASVPSASPTALSHVAQDTIPPAQVAEGKAIFEGKRGALCVTCHGKNGKGVTGLGPDLTDSNWLHGDGSLPFLQSVIRAGVMKPRQSASVMPPMGGASLNDEQLKAVASYVYTLSRPAK